jgi:hypothetical protein
MLPSVIVGDRAGMVKFWAALDAEAALKAMCPSVLSMVSMLMLNTHLSLRHCVVSAARQPARKVCTLQQLKPCEVN